MRMANPEVDLGDFSHKARLYAEHGKDVNKSLDVVLFWDGEGMSTFFKVCVNKICVLRTCNFQLAINTYNKPTKYSIKR